MLGVCVTLVVLTIDRLGGLLPWERQSIDWRFRDAPRPPRPMSDQIVHVDIDDGAIDQIGRWPWPRARLAEAIDELRRAGAKTIALDLLLSDPSDPKDARDDRQFAETLRRTRCVTAVTIPSGELYDDAWLTERGSAELSRIMTTLGEDIRLENDAVLERAEVTGDRRQRYVARPLLFKQAAAWRVLQNATPPFESLDAYEHAVTPGLEAGVGYYIEKPIIESAWRQHRAWRLMRRFLLPGDTRGTFRDKAPLPEFVDASSAVGFVDVKDQIDSDGVMRKATIKRPAEGGSAVHFAVAAAASFRGVDSARLTVTGDRLNVGDVTLPLRHGSLFIDWPTSSTDPRWLGLLRQDADAPPDAGHLSIRTIVELARLRHSNTRNLAEVTRYILLDMGNAVPETVPDDAMLKPDVQREVADEVDFALSGPPPRDDANNDDKRKYQNAVNWRRLHQAVEADRPLIAASEAALRPLVDGKLVFVGWTATSSIADFLPTALDDRTPGVVVHAAIANMVLTGRHVRFMPAWLEVVLLLTVGLLCTVIASSLPTLPSSIAMLVVLIGYGSAAFAWLFPAYEMLAPMVGPLAAGGASWVACTALQAALAQRERQRITRQFRARVSAQLVDHLVNHPDAVTVSGDEREMTILFGDLAGFTTISENLGGRVTVSTLNRYMSELTRLLIERDAYMNKFLGDGLMAFWSAFSIDTQQAAKACAAAVECQAAVKRLNDQPEFADIPKLGLRLGIATGRVIVGDCGAPPALNDYTVIGDAVNLAARLESANKQFGTRILINGRTEELIDTSGSGDNAVRLRAIGRIIVVGQSKPVDVFEVVGADMPDEQIALTESMADAFREGRFDDALRFADRLAELYGEAKLVGVYRHAVELARNDDAFDGVLRLQEK